MYKIKLSPYAKMLYNEWMLDPNSNHYNITATEACTNVVWVINAVP